MNHLQCNACDWYYVAQGRGPVAELRCHLMLDHHRSEESLTAKVTVSLPVQQRGSDRPCTGAPPKRGRRREW